MRAFCSCWQEASLEAGSPPGLAAPHYLMSSYYDSISTEALLSLDSMEGVYSLPVVEKRAAATATAAPHSVWPGYSLTALTAAIAYTIHYLPLAPFRVAGETGVRRPVSAAM